MEMLANKYTDSTKRVSLGPWLCLHRRRLFSLLEKSPAFEFLSDNKHSLSVDATRTLLAQ